MKKILSTFLLSAMLVLVLGGCESEDEVWTNSEQEEAIYDLERDVERLENQVYAVLCELKYRHALKRRWEWSPFRHEAAYHEWAGGTGMYDSDRCAN